jgi:hypothetical protein
VVEEPSRRHTVAFALLILLVMGVAIFAAVSLNALAATTSVQVRELDGRVAEAERYYAQLVADVAALEDPRGSARRPPSSAWFRPTPAATCRSTATCPPTAHRAAWRSARASPTRSSPSCPWSAR